VNVYSSLPAQGINRGQTSAVVMGARLALQESGGQAGGVSVNYIPLSNAQKPGFADERTSAENARRAASDPNAVAYLGEFFSNSTAVSLPILNRAGILQVSPSNTYQGLTVGGPGTRTREPERYFPTGRRTYGRVVPNNVVQAAALATLMKASRCRSTFLISDDTTYGAGIVANARRASRRLRLHVSGQAVADKNRRSYEDLARRIHAPCALYGGVTGSNAVQVFRSLGARKRHLRFFSGDGVAEEAFANPRKGGIPRDIARRTLLTVATLGESGFPPPGRQFFERFRAAYQTRIVDPYAAYGYEAMSVVLAAIDRAAPQSTDRGAVVDAFFQTRDRASVLGTYSIDANGDTTLRDYGVYRISRGLLTFSRRIIARGLP
jgi:branched-chain amino acid transport system substrate-binding protein